MGKIPGLLIWQALDHPGLDGEIATVIKEYIELLRSRGMLLNRLNFILDYVVPAYYILTTAEASATCHVLTG